MVDLPLSTHTLDAQTWASCLFDSQGNCLPNCKNGVENDTTDVYCCGIMPEDNFFAGEAN